MTQVTPRGRRATSRDVADEAGVSRSTVSEILNGRADRFPPDTRDRVLAVAARLDYVPSPAGRMLVTGKSSTVLVLLPSVSLQPAIQVVLDALIDDLAAKKLQVVAQFARGDSSEVLKSVLRLNPIAVVDLTRTSKEVSTALQRSGVLVVPQVDSTQPDMFNRGIGHAMVERLSTHPIDRYLYATSTDERDFHHDPERLAGVTEALAAMNLPAPAQVSVPMDLDGAILALRPLLVPPGPVGVLCYTDSVALAVTAVCRELELSIPADVAVIGVDALPEGQLASPRLTTVYVDPSVLAQALANELTAGLAGTKPERAASGTVPFSIIDGQTA